MIKQKIRNRLNKNDDLIQNVLEKLFDADVLQRTSYIKTYRNLVRKKSLPQFDSQIHELFRRDIVANAALDKYVLFMELHSFDVANDPTHRKIIAEIEGCTKEMHLLIAPRGNWKSTGYGCLLVLWKYLRDSINNKFYPSCMVFHGDLTKASNNLALIAAYAKTDIMQYLYPDVLNIDICNDKELSFYEVDSVKRADPHFFAASIDGDKTGQHPNRFYIDDIVTEKNSENQDQRDHIKKVFKALISLEEHFFAKPEYILRGTRYAKNTIYTELIDEESWSETIHVTNIPASTIVPNNIEDGFGELNFPRSLPVEKLKRYFRTMPSFQFYSQYYGIEYDPESALAFNATLPEYYSPFAKEDIEFSTLLIDPSISYKNKNSRFTMLVVMVTRSRKIFVVDGYSSIGTTPTISKNKIFDFAKKYSLKYVIIESIAYQEYFRQDVMTELLERRRKDPSIEHFTCVPHKHSENKKLHYRNFLEPLLSSQIIYINPNMSLLIKQITGMSSLEDELDCLSFLKELKIDYYRKDKSNEIIDEKLDYKRKKKNNRNNFSPVCGW